MIWPRWRRHEKLWLLLFLCWFVSSGDPVTQETRSEEIERSEKVYPAGDTAQLDVKVTRSTPNLVSLSHTDAIISENIDPNSLIITPAVAPATPWEDIKLSSLVADVVPDEIIKPSHIKEQFGSESPTHKENKDITEDPQFIDKAKVMKDMNESVRNLDPNQAEPADDPSSEIPVPEGGGIDDNATEIYPDGKQHKISQDEDSKKDELYQATEESREFSPSSTRELMGEGHEKLDVSAEELQAPDGDEDLSGTPEDLAAPREDMPSFKEWSQKFLAQEEQKNKVQQNNEKGSSETSSPTKKKKSDRKQNNYASVDCGAKILENNIEARNAESILIENKDFYMLNPCSASISFVVELCDHVHVTSLQLANFEMFSSTTETFQVSFSTRYPTREWTQLQTFTAKSEKLVQTFRLDPIFAKYMKVEQLSHHGSEHYCPWSLLRVYGNSMVEEYEEHESSQDSESNVEEDESTLSSVTEDQHVSNGILHTATEAVLNFVKETAKKLVSTPTAVNSSSANETNSTNMSSSQQLSNTENSKVIVQLMDREDFEASCQEATKFFPKKCLPRTDCDSMENTVYNYEMFLEIIHHVCRRDLRSSKACFTNLSKILAVNKTVEKPALILKPKENDEIQAAVRDEIASKDASTTIEANSLNQEEYSQTIGNLESLDIHENVNNVEKEHDTTQYDNSHPRSSSGFESDETHVEVKHKDTVVFPLSASSSTCGNSDSVNSDSVRITSDSDTNSSSSESSNSDTTSSISHQGERPSSPTPLPQPPLAVQQQPISERSLSEQTTSDMKEDMKKISVASSTERTADSFITSETTVPSGSQSSVTKHVIPPGTISPGTISPGTATSVSRENVASGDLPALSVNVADIRVGDSAPREQRRGENEDKNLVLESVKEDKPNSHIDVLKITLTDQETKEGRAELVEREQSNQDDVGVQDSSGEKESLRKVNVVEDVIIPNETESSSKVNDAGMKEELNTLDVINGSDTKEQNGGNKKDDGIEVKTPKDPGDKKVIFEQEETKKDQEMASDGTLAEPITDEKPKPQNDDLKKEYLCSPEGTCDQRETGTESEYEQTKPMKIEGEDDGSEGEADLGPNIPASNGEINGKKESIFVAMSRKIKGLEQNVTMTNLFLEELSQRYRKSLEEMQNKLEKKLSLVSKHSKLLTKVNAYQNSTILTLTTKLEKLERALEGVTLRLKVVNQEVVERHLLGMCLQFLIVFLLWFFFVRTRRPSITEQTVKERNSEYEPLRNAVVPCDDNVFKDVVHDTMKSSFEESNLPKTPELLAESKRRKKRRHRSGAYEHFFAHVTNHDQNIVTRTAGLLFHTPVSHDDGAMTTHKAAQRSCSLNDLGQSSPDLKAKTKKPAVSPCKVKKTAYRNGGEKENVGSKMRLFGSDDRKMDRREGFEINKGLVKSKSFNDKSDLNGLTSCSLEATNTCDKIKNQKSRWIWGLG